MMIVYQYWLPTTNGLARIGALVASEICTGLNGRSAQNWLIMVGKTTPPTNALAAGLFV